MGEGGLKVLGKMGDVIYGQTLRKMHCAQNYVFNMGFLFTLDTYLYLFDNKICLRQNKSRNISFLKKKNPTTVGFNEWMKIKALSENRN